MILCSPLSDTVSQGKGGKPGAKGARGAQGDRGLEGQEGAEGKRGQSTFSQRFPFITSFTELCAAGVIPTNNSNYLFLCSAACLIF